MHIGVLTHNYPRFAGDFSGVFVRALCAEFARQEHAVTVWAPFDPAFEQADGPTRSVQACAGTIDLRLYRYAWPDRLHRLGYMRTMQSDLALRLEAYALSPALFGAGIAAVMRQAARVRPDVLHAHWALPNGFIAAVVARRLKIPLVVSIPGSDAQVAGQNPLFRALARYTFRQADLLTANSEALRDAVVALGADPGKFDMIIYGTDPHALQPDSVGTDALRARLDIPAATPVFLCVGRMVGAGDELANWQQLSRDLGIDARVRWAGVVPHDEIGVYYNMADALVMPSVSKPADGLNVCVLDAMSCAKPVVGSTVAGNRLAVVDGETGFIVPEGDVDALARALARLAQDPDLVARMGAVGRKRIETELGWPHLARRYVAHFRRLAGMGEAI
jgi:glycosyltransferase involved in cell wall biosynthesis